MSPVLVWDRCLRKVRIITKAMMYIHSKKGSKGAENENLLKSRFLKVQLDMYLHVDRSDSLADSSGLLTRRQTPLPDRRYTGQAYC